MPVNFTYILSPFNIVGMDRIGILTQLKQEIDAHNNNDQELEYLTQIKTKMSSRVSNYETTFTGSIFPQSLLVYVYQYLICTKATSLICDAMLGVGSS